MNKYGSDYQIKKALSEKSLYMKEKGIYSDKPYVPELAVITSKYPKGIITMNSAFFYYDLTDTIPDYNIATPSRNRKISDSRVKQIYENSDYFDLGVTTMNRDEIDFLIYDRERLLIEIIRNKNKMPFDYYKELILSYRAIVNKLDIPKISGYAYLLPKTKTVMDTLRKEVL